MASQNMKDRRAIITGLGAVAAAGALAVRSADAQGTPPDSFTPTLHPQDDWMSAIRGSKHRIVLDVTSPTGVPDAIRFSGQLAHRPQERVGRRGVGRRGARLLPSSGHPLRLRRRDLGRNTGRQSIRKPRQFPR